MKQLIPVILIFALLPAGCGGNDTPENRPISKYVPDFSTPAGVTEAYAQAVETYDVELMEQVIVPDEREDELKSLRRDFESNEENGVTVRIEFPNAHIIDDETARAEVRYYFIKDGVESETPRGFWVVFVKLDDAWYYSPRRSIELNRRIQEEARKKQEEDAGEEEDADEDAGEEDEAPESGGDPDAAD